MAPYMTTIPAKEIIISASFRMFKCSMFNRAGDCQNSFGVHAWKTSRKIDATRHLKISSNYKFVGDFEPMPWSGSHIDVHNITLKIDMEGYSGIYLAFEGNKGTLILKKVTAYYVVCRKDYKDRLIRFQLTPVPNSKMRVERVAGFCARNAVHAEDKGTIAMSCYANATTNVTGLCLCAPGFWWIQKLKECFRKCLKGEVFCQKSLMFT